MRKLLFVSNCRSVRVESCYVYILDESNEFYKKKISASTTISVNYPNEPANIF